VRAHPLIDDRLKGVPGGVEPFPLEEVGRKGWNVLAEDLPLPLAVLKESAMSHNSRWMQRFVSLSGAVIAPHGKTTMSPELFHRQLDDGAWGITLSNAAQLHVARAYGIRRVLLANQLVGRQAIRYVLDELARDPEFDFYCLVDSVELVKLLAAEARRRAIGRPLQVLVEGGHPGGRTGCRTLEGALAVAREVKAAEPHLALRGAEGFEGVLGHLLESGVEAAIDSLLGFVVDIAVAAERESLFAPGPIILSAGGSGFYDLVLERFRAARLERPVQVVTRSGCYLTHDDRAFQDAFRGVLARSEEARSLGEGLKPAIEVWAYVQSVPEPGRALLTMGKRDVSYDMGLPVPLKWFRPGVHSRPEPLGSGYAITMLNDQHAYLTRPEGSPLAVGDMVASGISHPCTTFDKWQLMLVVDDDYRVVGGVRTFF
jgi:D-serine dehydratase